MPHLFYAILTQPLYNRCGALTIKEYKQVVKYKSKTLASYIGTGILLCSLPSLLHAADTSGWDCVRAANGDWDCSGSNEPAKAKPIPAPRGPITPPQLPKETPTTEPEPVRESEPAIAAPPPSPDLPTPKPAAKPAPDTETLPGLETDAAKPVTPTPVAKPTPAPKPAPVVKARPEPRRESDVVSLTPPAKKRFSGGEIVEGYELCGQSPRPPRIAVPAGGRTNAEVKLSADEANLNKTGVSSFSGNVKINRADQRLKADKLDYNRDTEIMDASGNVELQDNNILIVGDKARIDLGADKTRVNDAEFNLYTRHGRGTARKLRRNGNTNVTKLDDTVYTTCNAGNDDWYLNADYIKLDQESGVGTARNVSVNFKGIPFFYSPFLTFPIDDRRKSGFLTPTIGSSDESGTEISAPYYWNIAPNRDATITPRILSKRGVQLGGEYRYLNGLNNGVLNAELLPDDDVFNDDRYLFSYKSTSRPSSRWNITTDLNYVSDDEYFEDLGTDISLTSQINLEQRIDARYSGDFWSFTGRVQGFDTLNDTDGPYKRLPQLLLSGSLPNQHFGLTYGLRAEAVYFDRSNSATGSRLDVEPSVSLPWQNSYAFATPRVALRHTRYSLSNVDSRIDDSPTRTLPIFTLDTGLLFERDTSFGGSQLTQTLEPRLFYVNIPERNQDNLIVNEQGEDVVFDSGAFDLSFAQLFRANRFTGADRVGDANQLTSAITTRFVDNASGLERASFSLGQITYFDDREVSLPGQVDDDDDNSDLIAEVSARITRNLSTRADIIWDPSDSETQEGAFSLRYQSDDKRIVNLSYRFQDQVIEQTDLAASWPLSNQWNAVGRWNYALDRDRTIDAFAGVEYESCCYIFRVVARQFINDLDQDNENFALLFQLELKGLTSFGDKVTTFLEDGILGYGRDPFGDDDF